MKTTLRIDHIRRVQLATSENADRAEITATTAHGHLSLQVPWINVDGYEAGDVINVTFAKPAAPKKKR